MNEVKVLCPFPVKINLIDSVKMSKRLCGYKSLRVCRPFLGDSLDLSDFPIVSSHPSFLAAPLAPPFRQREHLVRLPRHYHQDQTVADGTLHPTFANHPTDLL